MTAAGTLQLIKERLQHDQELVFAANGDNQSSGNLAFRAEIDALWAGLEVIAQVVDGKSVRVPDYFSNRRAEL